MTRDERWACIDTEALAANFAMAERLADGREVIAVVKADAYGHGAAVVAETLVAAGCGRFAVLSVDEAVALRHAGVVAPILVLAGVPTREAAALACRHALVPVVHHAEGLALVREAAQAAGEPCGVQIEVDTGMSRMGVSLESAAALAAAVDDSAELRLEGVFTHLACADDPDPAPSLAQLERFRGLLTRLRDQGIDPGSVHAVNSAGLLAGDTLAAMLPEANAVRPGLMLFGVRPAQHLDPRGELRPVMSLHGRVLAVRDVGPGEAVGYGATHRPKEPARIATVGLGYADGVLRSLGNGGEVWLAGGRRPIVGRVSMDYITVDVTDADVRVGDVATLYGAAPDESAPRGAVAGEGASGWCGVRVEDAAEAAGTLAYELLVRVGARVSRRPI
jgi:alanine racemase